MIKLEKSCALLNRVIWRFKNFKIPSTSEDIWEKPNFPDFVFIFFSLYLKRYDNANFTFPLQLFLLYKLMLLDFQSDVSFLSNHHQLWFFKYSTTFFLSLKNSNFNSKYNNMSLFLFTRRFGFKNTSSMLFDEDYEETKRRIKNRITSSCRGEKMT